MTGPIIPAGEWPEWADRHCWDESGFGYFYGVQQQVALWASIDMPSKIPLPPGHDWRVPVMRTQPAPVIDLEQFREAVEELYSSKLSRYENGEALGDEWMEGAEAERIRLLALIDGQEDTTVADTLRTLLAERNHRTDGTLQELADRCLHLSRGDRDLLALRGNLIAKLQPTKGEGD